MFLLEDLDILFSEADNNWLTGISLINNYYIESENDSVLDKIFKLFKSYSIQLSDLTDMKKDRNFMINTLYHLDKIFKQEPKLKKEKMQFRGWERFKEEKDYGRKMAVNLSVIADPSKNSDIRTFINDYEWNKGADTWYSTTVEGMYKIILDELKILNKEISDVEKELFSFKEMMKKSKDVDLEDKKNIFLRIIDQFRSSFKRRIYIISLNLESMKYNMGKKLNTEIEEDSKKSDVKVVLKSDKWVFENSKKIKTIDIMGKKFDIYQAKTDKMFMMNYKGITIYVNKSFFTYPKGYQEAILFHEIGHAMAGHFEPDHMDDYRDYYDEFSKKWNLYKYYIDLEKRFAVKDNEFVYIMMELEADEYSANRVGKKQMGEALNFAIDDVLKNEPKINRDYNKFRANIRTKLM